MERMSVGSTTCAFAAQLEIALRPDNLVCMCLIIAHLIEESSVASVSKVYPYLCNVR